jgi:hypothetical protein
MRGRQRRPTERFIQEFGATVVIARGRYELFPALVARTWRALESGAVAGYMVGKEMIEYASLGCREPEIIFRKV